MSELPDHDRIRKLLNRLDAIQRESEQIRERIINIRRESPEFPNRREDSRLFDGIGSPDLEAANHPEADDYGR